MAKHGKRIQYYLKVQSSSGAEKYISKKQIKTIRTYLQKSYNEKALKLVSREIQVLEKFAERYCDNLEAVRCLYSDLPDEMKAFIDPIDVTDEDYVRSWMNIPFESKAFQDMETWYVTDRKERVRSKSELNIANALNRVNIPYKYECPLELRKGITIYPDFTILNPIHRKIYYWEHRGMMDDREYAKHAVARIKDYGRGGIMLGRELIITEETANTPLGSDEIARVIKTYFQS
ncbi:MAG: hypothetical protein Q4B22_10840 [Eubacteriales bacterium]|nr:hypothetical protein [Eubacteriales bacterium]